MEGLVKLAASFDARRSKQYWQLLKRQYGGGDEAVNAIKQTGDDGIWHGAHPMMMDSIAKEGLNPSGRMQLWGRGQYFAPKNLAEGYTRHTGEAGLIRLKKPSELRGTKELYPDVQNAVKQDLQPETMHNLRSNARQGGLFHKDNIVQDMNRTRDNMAEVASKKMVSPVRKQRVEMKGQLKGLQTQFDDQMKQFKGISNEINEGFPSLKVQGEQKTWPSNVQKFRTYGQKPLPFMEGVNTNYLVYGNKDPIKPELLKFPNGGN